MFMQRIFTDGLAQTSFVIGSAETLQALVIDPRRDIAVYLDAAEAQGLKITHIMETHIHADYASGALELTSRTGATIYESAIGDNEFTHEGLHHGDVIQIGEVRIEALHTPGHTPEHVCFLVSDTAHPKAAPLLFSGDALFVGSVGRPDLLGEAQTRSLAEALYETIHNTLMHLDDDIIVYPGHGAGSACGKSIGDAPSTTMGQEKRFNYAFQPMPRDEFVRLILDGLPEPPPYFPVMKKLNKQGPGVLSGIPRPRQLELDDLKAIQNGDRGEVTLLDVRSSEEFSRGFLRGSLNIGLEPAMSNWAGWAVPYDQPIALIVGSESDVPEAMTYLIRIGLDAVCGYSVADLDDWQRENLEIRHIDQMNPDAIYHRIQRDGLQVLDVRNPDEWSGGHIAGAANLAVGPLSRGAGDGLDPERPVAVTCAAGYRSSLGASVLKARGFKNVINITGGMDAWRDAGLPVESHE